LFDIGWTEMLVVACVAVIVVGPKDLPKMLRTVGKTVSGLRRMAGDFQKQFDDAIREADLDDVRDIAKGKGFAPLDDVKNSAKAFQDQVRAEMDGTRKQLNEAADAAKVTVGKLPEPAGGGSGSASAAKASEPSEPRVETKKPVSKASMKPAAKSTAPKTKKPAAKTPAKKAKATAATSPTVTTGKKT
jgi:sec-independent protein translocase protein TatB